MTIPCYLENNIWLPSLPGKLKRPSILREIKKERWWQTFSNHSAYGITSSNTYFQSWHFIGYDLDVTWCQERFQDIMSLQWGNTVVPHSSWNERATSRSNVHVCTINLEVSHVHACQSCVCNQNSIKVQAIQNKQILPSQNSNVPIILFANNLTSVMKPYVSHILNHNSYVLSTSWHGMACSVFIIFRYALWPFIFQREECHRYTIYMYTHIIV